MRFSKASIHHPLAAILALALAGCLDDHEDHEDEVPWEHACEHAGDATTAVTANADNALAPDVSEVHTHYGVAFTAGSKVKFTADVHGEFGIFLTKHVPVVLTTAAGDTVEFEETETELTGCADLAVMHTADLEAGVHYLSFGASPETSVGLIREELAHHDH